MIEEHSREDNHDQNPHIGEQQSGFIESAEVIGRSLTDNASKECKYMDRGLLINTISPSLRGL